VRRLAVALAVAGTLVLLAGCTAEGDRDGSPVASVSTGSSEAAPTTPGGPLTADTGLLPCPEVFGGPAQGPDTLPPMTFDCIGGGSLDLGQAAGVPRVVSLWGSWCPPCREELPVVQQLADVAGDRVQVLGVATRDRLTAADSFAADAGVTFPSAYDREGELMVQLGINALPYTYFVDAAGSVTFVQVGPVKTLADFEQLVSEHLGVQL